MENMTDSLREFAKVEMARRGIKQTDMAQATGISRGYINTAIQGKGGEMPKVWQAILGYLDVELMAIPKDKVDDVKRTLVG